GLVIHDVVRLGEVGQAAYRNLAVSAFKTGHTDPADLAFRIGAAPEVVSQASQGVQLAASGTSLRSTHLQVSFLLDVVLDRLAAGHDQLHEVEE
ncbi:MAG: hypothetical protein WCN95_16360, partial [bacterium]